ncbi:MAG: LCP family protein [Propionibacteriaceae bacterium]
MSLRTDQPAIPPAAQIRSEKVKLRRGLTFVAMTLVLPGSAQLAAGNRTVGRIALRSWLALWALIALGVVLALTWRSALITLVALPPTLPLVQGLLVVLAVGWAGLFVDAWRISRPPELGKRHRLGFAILNLTLVLLVSGGLLASASMVSAQRSLLSSVFGGGGNITKADGRYNILLLGGDAGKTRVGLRPDSITVASVDADTGRTVLLSLPRNLEDVPFPDGSPMQKAFPAGYSCADHSCMLNAVYTYATEHPGLYPGVKDPGIQATKEAVEGALGLRLNYYALVDLKGFQALVDAVGGINLDVNTRVPMGGHGSRIFGYIEPGKNKHLDGYHTLWFARSRVADSDYARMARQKCVMSAMLNQLDPVTVLTKFNQIAAAGKEIMATDVPPSQASTLMGLALAAKQKPISSVAFVPPLVYPGSPDFAKIHAKVGQAIAKSEAKDAPKPKSGPATAAPSSAIPTPSSTPSSQPKVDEPAPDTSDLANVCTAR